MKTNRLVNAGRLLFAAGTVSMLALSSCSKTTDDQDFNNEAIAETYQAPQSRAGEVVPNEIIVKFLGGLQQKSKENVLDQIGGTVEELIFTKVMQRGGESEGIYLVRTPLDVFDAIAKLKGNSSIAYAEPNFVYYHTVDSNDPYYKNGSLWGMYGDATSPANQYGSQAGEAWAANHTGSSSVFVGVIDEGAMFSHTDLAANFWTNPYDPVDGEDNDGNGYVDDVHGWDFANNDNSTFDGLSDDHGTHVSGTIGAKGGNGTGVAGVNWSVTMISAKFLGSNGGTTANAIKAVDYITDLKTRHGMNIPATNNSWGGGGSSQALQAAIERANDAGILFIAAAGNDGSNNDVTFSYPSGYSNANVISVASITSSGAISSFSNYGATTVDIGAPGSGIYSTLPVRNRGNVGSGYGSYSGTSMATPHVTGAAALYASRNEGASAATIKNAILSSAVPTASLKGKCFTGGRLNVSGF